MKKYQDIRGDMILRFAKAAEMPGKQKQEIISKTINNKNKYRKITLVNTARWFNAMNQKVKLIRAQGGCLGTKSR